MNCFFKPVLFAFVLSLSSLSFSEKITMEIKISCPASPELTEFLKSIPKHESANFEEWKQSLTNSMNQLIRLMESKKVASGNWSVKTDRTILREIK